MLFWRQNGRSRDKWPTSAWQAARAKIDRQKTRHLARRVTDIPRRAVAAGSSATTGNRRAQDRTGAAMVALVGEALVFTGEGF
jgi:hypothetical protein